MPSGEPLLDVGHRVQVDLVCPAAAADLVISYLRQRRTTP
jgi:hypothetical protein